MRRVILLTAFTVALAFSASAQQSTVLDGLYVKEHAPARKVIPYTYLREADVTWLKRVWRRIDLREKLNHQMYYPTSPIADRKSLFDVLVDAIVNEGTVTAYALGPLNDDEFTMPMTVDEVKKQIYVMDTVMTTDLDGNMVEQVVANDIKSDMIKWYDVKEEWFFDRQRSVMDVRIIGICPMKERKNDAGEVMGPQGMFWVYFPEARYVFANAIVFNKANDSERRTYEDIFWKRQFSSYIIKENNVHDRFIMEYKTGLDALLEAEKIKNDMFLLEHDMWHF